LNLTGRSIPPGAITGLREWWIGKAYARCLLRTAGASMRIAELQEHLRRPSFDSTNTADDCSSRVFLGFLLDGQGKSELAESQWLALAGKPNLEALASPPIPAAKPGEDKGT
jgi:hypothetical protein